MLQRFSCGWRVSIVGVGSPYMGMADMGSFFALLFARVLGSSVICRLLRALFAVFSKQGPAGAVVSTL